MSQAPIDATQMELIERIAELEAENRQLRETTLEEAASNVENGSAYSGYEEIGKIHAQWIRSLAPMEEKMTPQRVSALKAENRQLREALNSLTHEICGWLGLYEEFLRPYSGHTNIAVMKHKVEVARAALAATEEKEKDAI